MNPREQKRKVSIMTSYIAHEFYRNSRQYVTKRLSRMPYAQAGVIIDNDGTHLISYTTHVCTIDKDGWLTCTGTYSATTRKHIGAFMREYAPQLSYYDAKAAYEKGHKINIYTGEIVSLA